MKVYDGEKEKAVREEKMIGEKKSRGKETGEKESRKKRAGEKESEGKEIGQKETSQKETSQKETSQKETSQKETDRNMSLDETFAMLDEMLDELESAEISLEESFRVYKEGMGLLKKCNDTIDGVEKKVLKLNENGELEEL